MMEKEYVSDKCRWMVVAILVRDDVITGGPMEKFDWRVTIINR